VAYPFPLRVRSPTSAGAPYHVVDSTGAPYLIHGESAWSLIVGNQQADVLTYLNDRAARGTNAILVQAISHGYTDNTPEWRNAYGDLPFDAGNNFDQPNEPYWQHVDWVVDRAAERGIALIMAHSYLGSGGGDQGWYAPMGTNGNTKLGTYGQWYGARYRNKHNIIHLAGGDFTPPDTSRTAAVVDGILATDMPGRLHTAHCQREDSAYDVWQGIIPLHLNSIYTGSIGAADDIYTEAERVVDQTSMPAFTIELIYEYEHDSTNQQLRRQTWWSGPLSGSCGQLIGVNPVWCFSQGFQIFWEESSPPGDDDWHNYLGSPASVHNQVASFLLKSRRWFDLVRDDSHLTVTAGFGTAGQLDYVSCGRTADGALVVAYLPTSRTITLDTNRMSGPFDLRWYSPVNGALHGSSGGPYPRNGLRTFAAPGANTDPEGASDWVMIAEVRPRLDIAPWPIPRSIGAVRR
jgi:hypothetical protein